MRGKSKKHEEADFLASRGFAWLRSLFITDLGGPLVVPTMRSLRPHQDRRAAATHERNSRSSSPWNGRPVASQLTPSQPRSLLSAANNWNISSVFLGILNLLAREKSPPIKHAVRCRRCRLAKPGSQRRLLLLLKKLLMYLSPNDFPIFSLCEFLPIYENVVFRRTLAF